MKNLYICEECGKQFSTEAEALACEAAHLEEKARTSKLLKAKKEREKEICNKYKEILSLIEQYNKDYNEPARVPYSGALSKLIDTIFDFHF